MFMSLKEDFLEGGGCAENCFHFRFGQFFCFWTIFLLLDNFFALDNFWLWTIAKVGGLVTKRVQTF